MKIIKLVSFYTLLIVISACSSVQVSTDHSEDADFSNLKTFKWLNVSTEGKDPRMDNTIMYSRITNTINKQLSFQGYSKIDTTPDFFINFDVLTEDKVDVRNYNTYGGYPAGWGWGAGYGHRGYGGYGGVYGGYSETTVKEYKKGTLIIDIIDPTTNQLIWRGLGSKRLPSTSNPEKMDELVFDVVESILKNFPPK